MANEAEYRRRIEALEEAFEASYDGIHILDSDGRTLLINKACERIEGITKEDIGDKTISRLVEEGYYDKSVTLMVLDEKREVTELQRAKNGKSILVTGMPIYDDSGEIVRVIVNSRDITELMDLREQLRHKENLLNMYKEELNFYNMRSKFIANSKPMKMVIKTAVSVAKVNSNVLITGESGTGKSLVAEIIHKNSSRKERDFVKIDCGAIPDNLFESELFGYEGGAFTGADSKGKAGLVEMADGGTLFLDEIGEISPMSQAKLLRFIQEKQFYKIGGKEPVEVDVRIIAATNRDLEEMVKEKAFREDLLYRINVIPIEIPPLRKRKEDILPLVLNRLRKINNEYDMKRSISAKAMDKLIEYGWPGNVRELENVIERIAVTASGDEIKAEELPETLLGNSKFYLGGGSMTYRALMDSYEREILEKLIAEGCSPKELSEILAIDVTTVRRKLHKYGIKFR